MTHNILGMSILIVLGYLVSYNRSHIKWSTLFRLLSFTIGMAYFLIRIPLGKRFVISVANTFSSLYSCADRGIDFLFGALAQPQGPWGFIFAFKVLPIIIFFSALISVLNYVGFLAWIIGLLGKIVRPLFGTEGAETLCAVANSVLGQTEAPILIKSNLSTMSESEIFAVMVAGMGTLSAGIMGVYSSLGFSMQHLLTSSIISISSALFIAKLWYPETQKNHESKPFMVEHHKSDTNALDALARGGCEGAMLAINIGAMLLVTISLLGCFDDLLAYIAQHLNSFFHHAWITTYLSVKGIFSLLGVPAAWLIGVAPEHLQSAGHLIGMKVAVNEMVAYSQGSQYLFDERTKILLTYALCGFSNFSCIGIQLGGIGILAPSVRPIIGKLGVRAVFAAACVNLLNACIIGLFI